MQNMEHDTDIHQMHLLIRQINEASDAYYGSGTEIMSNHEWDTLYDELKALEEKTGIIMTNSPTQNVGGESGQVNSSFEKMKHEISVKSLDKTKDVDALAAFIGDHPGIMWEKRNWRTGNGQCTKLYRCTRHDSVSGTSERTW